MGHISKFGLLELSRQRLRPAPETSTYTPCTTCQGRGRVKSVTALGLSLLRQMSLQLGQAPLREVRALLPPEVANFLLNQKRKELFALEEQHNLKITLTARPGLPLEEIQLEYVKPEAGDQQGGKGEAKETRRAQQVDEIRPGKVSPPLSS